MTDLLSLYFSAILFNSGISFKHGTQLVNQKLKTTTFPSKSLVDIFFHLLLRD